VLVLLASIEDATTSTGGWGGTPPVGAGIPDVYWQMHVAAGEYYGVNPFLVASIHETESAFSKHPAVRQAWNACKAAGPMQFGVVGVAPYNAPRGGCSAGGTWDAYKFAFKPIEAARPAEYPLNRRTLESCRPVPPDTGCVYDDFDAIAGAAQMLAANGADARLDSPGTRNAVFAYNHSDSYVNEVLGQARAWEQMGATSGPPVAPTSGGARGIVERAVAIAEPFGTFVVSDHRPQDLDSDHHKNDSTMAARDIAVQGINALVGPPSPRLDQAVVEIGARLGRSYRPGTTIIDTFEWKGFRIQILWRTPLYGGHMGHIHIGARRVTDKRR
jgi:hypothetical protein